MYRLKSWGVHPASVYHHYRFFRRSENLLKGWVPIGLIEWRSIYPLPRHLTLPH
jgi:hypothetical protein